MGQSREADGFQKVGVCATISNPFGALGLRVSLYLLRLQHRILGMDAPHGSKGDYTSSPSRMSGARDAAAEVVHLLHHPRNLAQDRAAGVDVDASFPVPSIRLALCVPPRKNISADMIKSDKQSSH